MLLAVGGGFFSSSAFGYSKGLTLLVLGKRNKEKPMRVTPWNQYQLVDQVTDPNFQLASAKNLLVRGCASFVCFGCTTTGPESTAPLKVGPTQNQDVLPEPVDFHESKDQAHLASPIVDDDYCIDLSSLKSSLKKSEKNASATVVGGGGGGGNSNKHETLPDKSNGVAVAHQIDKRKVQWTDTTGGELFEIREFEMSEDGSDYEFDHETGKICSCRVM